MPIKINELVIQVKVVEDNKQVDPKDMSANGLLPTTEQQKLALAKDVLNLLEDREAR